MTRKLQIAILIFSLAGVILSGVSVYNHYSATMTGYCDFNELFNCDLVNRSSYARILGVPVAWMGLLGFGFLMTTALTNGGVVWAGFRFCASLMGLAFALYLAFIEAFVLRTWCLLCIGSLAAIAGVAILAGIDWWQTWVLPERRARQGAHEA